MRMNFFNNAVIAFGALVAGVLLSQPLHAVPGPQVDAETATQAERETTPVPVDDGVATLKPENTSIEFVGTHVGDEPKPRLGGFSEFEGKIEVNEAGDAIKSIQVEIDIASVWTEFNDLTNHLKNADFFGIDDFPKASFTSTTIAPAAEGRITVTGELTLHGTTSEITFEAAPEFNDKGLVVRAEFTIDRTNFGMDKMTSGVEPVVTLHVVVGQKTSPRESQPGHGGEESNAAAEESMAAAELVTLKLPNMV